MIGQNVDSPAAGQYAESKGMPWVGYDSDAKKFAPKSWLTAAVYNWGPYYLQARQGGDGRAPGRRGFYYGTIKDGFIDARPVRARRSRPTTKAAIAAKKAAIKNGTFYEFTGPLYDQRGKLRVPKGKRLTRQGPLRDELARQGRRSAAPKG